jgi:hypothetical protein
MGEPKLQDKPYEISKWTVWEAYRKVKANKGAPGVDQGLGKVADQIVRSASGRRLCAA